MFLTSILALTDFSADGDKALARAGQIAREHRAVLRLMYMHSGKHPACLDPDTRLAQTASAMAKRLGLTIRTVGEGNYSADNIMLQAKHAKLLVLPQRSERGFFATWLIGPEAIRFMRECRCPVLVARGAVRRRLRQIVVGVDFTPASQHRAMLACLLDRDALVELFHAVNTTGESRLLRADLDRSVLRRYRDNSMEHARVQMGRMKQSLYAHAIPVMSTAHIGEPAEQLLAHLAFTSADLVALGKSRRHAATDWLLRNPTHELLAKSPCDVMMVPNEFQLSATPSAMQRLKDPDEPPLRVWLATEAMRCRPRHLWPQVRPSRAERATRHGDFPSTQGCPIGQRNGRMI